VLAVLHRREVARTYLVECYWPGITEVAFADSAARAGAAARALRATGRDVEFLGSVLVPTDEVAFWRFASDTRIAVEEASFRAGLPYDRVMECVELPAEPASRAR
jgi:hypothetical protein